MSDNVNAVNIKDRYHHGDLARTLRAIALEMVEEGGPSALSLRETAKRAGVSPSAVYRHYPDRSGLLAAVAADGFALLNQAFDAGLAGCCGAVDRMRALGIAYVRFALAHPNVYRLLFGAPLSLAVCPPDFQEQSGRAYGTLQAQAAAFAASGDDPVLGAVRATAAWSMVHGYVMLRLDGHLPSQGPEADAELVLGAWFPLSDPGA